MPTTEKLSIRLPKELVDLLRAEVTRGAYGSVSDVVCAALQFWCDERRRTQLGVAALWLEGVQSGPGIFADIEEIKRAARARLPSG